MRRDARIVIGQHCATSARLEKSLTHASEAGYKICESLAWEKYLYVDDLSTDQDNRSQGCAAQIMDWLDEDVKRKGCAAMHLDSGVQRHVRIDSISIGR